jgi:hypothetical protein
MDELSYTEDEIREAFAEHRAETNSGLLNVDDVIAALRQRRETP